MFVSMWFGRAVLEVLRITCCYLVFCCFELVYYLDNIVDGFAQVGLLLQSLMFLEYLFHVRGIIEILAGK